jgi:hypothetical protein
LWEIVEDRTDDQSHNRVSKKLRKCQSWIPLQSPKSSTKAEFHLSNVGQCVRTADSLMLRLLYPSGVFESLKMFASEGVSIVVLINLLHESRALQTVLPEGSKFIRCSWNSAFPAISHNTFLRTRHRCEEICSRLPFGTIKANINKVILRICTSSEVYLASLV